MLTGDRRLRVLKRLELTQYVLVHCHGVECRLRQALGLQSVARLDVQQVYFLAAQVIQFAGRLPQAPRMDALPQHQLELVAVCLRFRGGGSGVAHRRQAQVLEENFMAGKKALGFENGAAHVAATLGYLPVKAGIHIDIEPAEQRKQQRHEKRTQQRTRCD